MRTFNPLSANPTNWMNCLSVFDHFVGLVLKVIEKLFINYNRNRVVYSSAQKYFRIRGTQTNVTSHLYSVLVYRSHQDTEGFLSSVWAGVPTVNKCVGFSEFSFLCI